MHIPFNTTNSHPPRKKRAADKLTLTIWARKESCEQISVTESCKMQLTSYSTEPHSQFQTTSHSFWPCPFRSTEAVKTLVGSFRVPLFSVLSSQFGVVLNQYTIHFVAILLRREAQKTPKLITPQFYKAQVDAPPAACSFQTPSADASCACKQCCCVTHMQFPAMLCNGRWQTERGLRKQARQPTGGQNRSAAELGGGWTKLLAAWWLVEKQLKQPLALSPPPLWLQLENPGPAPEGWAWQTLENSTESF